jgi:hypothetical protein
VREASPADREIGAVARLKDCAVSAITRSITLVKHQNSVRLIANAPESAVLRLRLKSTEF